jgi:hypothetical protein
VLPSCCRRRASGEDGDDVDTNNKTIQEAVFATIYTLTKSRSLDTSLRVAILRVVLEFLQVRARMRVYYASSEHHRAPPHAGRSQHARHATQPDTPLRMRACLRLPCMCAAVPSRLQQLLPMDHQA